MEKVQPRAHECRSFGQIVFSHAGAAAHELQMISPQPGQKGCIGCEALLGRICYVS